MYLFRKYLTYIILACITLGTGRAHALNESRRHELTDSIRRCLPQLTTSTDSISALYNILDLCSVNDRGPVAREIRNLALRAGNQEVALDMYLTMARAYAQNDTLLNQLLQEVAAMPKTTDQRDTYAQIRITKAMHEAEIQTPEQRMESLRQLVDEYHENADVVDIFQQVSVLFILCDYISYESGGELLEKYTNLLDEKIKLLPPSSRNRLLNSFWEMVARHYTINQQHAKAVKADRQLLELIAETDRYYAEHGRIYKNANDVHFQALCRLITNYEALSDSAVAAYYKQYLRLMTNDPSLKISFPHRELRLRAYYQMALHNYQAAIPLLNEVATDPGHSLSRRIFAYEQMRKAARAIGDEATLSYASEHYADLLEEQRAQRTEESSRELEIIYDMQRYNDERMAQAIDSGKADLERRQLEVIALAVSAAVLLIAALLIYYVYRRASNRNKRHRTYLKALRTDNHDLRRQLEAANFELQATRQALSNSRNVVNRLNSAIVPELLTVANNAQMLVDNTDTGDKKEYLQRFSSAIVTNVAQIYKLSGEISAEAQSSDKSPTP
jgi:hypothetical protein